MIQLALYRDRLSGGIQLAIEDESGGYRIFGPSFLDSEVLRRVDLSERDVSEIRRYLDHTSQLKGPA